MGSSINHVLLYGVIKTAAHSVTIVITAARDRWTSLCVAVHAVALVFCTSNKAGGAYCGPNSPGSGAILPGSTSIS